MTQPDRTEMLERHLDDAHRMIWMLIQQHGQHHELLTDPNGKAVFLPRALLNEAPANVQIVTADVIDADEHVIFATKAPPCAWCESPDHLSYRCPDKPGDPK